MKSIASSSNRRSDYRTILRDNLRKYWTVPAMGFAWYLFWGIIPQIMNPDTDPYKSALQDMATNQNFGYILTILILAVGSGITVFSYLQNPGTSNYIHSLPPTRSRLFAANVLSGMVMIAAPVLLNGLIMTLLAGNLWFVKWTILTLVSCFAIFSLTVLAGMLSGNTLMHLFNAGFCNGFVTVFLLVFYSACDSLLLGYASPGNWMTILFLSNPLTAFTGIWLRSLSLCILYALVGCAALAAARLLYGKRPLERTGESAMFPWVRTLLLVYCIFCGAILTGLVFAELLLDEMFLHVSLTMLVGMLLGAILIFLIGCAMLDRSAKIFTRRNLLPAAIALCLAIGMVCALGMDATGYGSRIPDRSDIEAVYIDPALDLYTSEPGTGDIGYYDLYSRFDARFYNLPQERSDVVGSFNAIGMRSEKSIEAARQLHRQLIRRTKSGRTHVGGDLTYTSTFDLVYQLKSGKKFRRTYPIYFLTDDSGIASTFDDSLIAAAEAYYNSEEFRQVHSLLNLKPEIFNKGTLTYYPAPDAAASDLVDDGAGEGLAGYPIPRKYAAQLKEALEKDYQQGDFLEECHAAAYLNITFSSGSDQYTNDDLVLPIPESYAHTKAWLDEHQDLLK